MILCTHNTTNPPVSGPEKLCGCPAVWVFVRRTPLDAYWYSRCADHMWPLMRAVQLGTLPWMYFTPKVFETWAVACDLRDELSPREDVFEMMARRRLEEHERNCDHVGPDNQ